jgi:gliding motility-associated-like protein
MNYVRKGNKLKNNISTLLFCFVFAFLQNISGQNHPGTGTIAPCGSCTPTGWTLDAGSPDVSDATQWGFNASAWTKTIQNPPNGETRWLTAHSTEVASMQITGLTSGAAYTLEFYVMAGTVKTPFIPGYGGTLSPVVRYSIDGGTVVSCPTPVEGQWYKQSVTFTAAGTSTKFTFLGGEHDGIFPGSTPVDGDLTNISFKPNGTVPATPTCPTINLTATQSVSICKGQTATLTATGPNPANYTYTWTPSGGSSTTASVSPSTTTPYTITVDSAGCKKNTTSFVVVDTIPVVSVNSTNICPGQSASLIASGATNYAWSPGTSLSPTTGANVTSTPAGNISYTVTGTTTAGCTGTAVSTIGINSSLVITVNSASICAGQNATLTAGGATTYSWAPNTSLSATTGISVTANPSANITYTVIGNTNGCTGTGLSTVTISSPAPPNAGADITICSGLTGNLGVAPTGGDTYSWSPSTGLSSSTVSNPTVTLTNVSASPVTSSYTLTANPGSCSSSDVVTVTVKPFDDASFSYTPSTICKTGGSDPTPVITGLAGGTFSCADVNLSLNTSLGIVTLASTPIGTYTVSYTTTGTCPDTKTSVISIVNVPDATFSYGGPYCQKETPNALPVFPVGSSAGGFTSSPAGLVFVSTATGEVNLTTSLPNTYSVTNTIAAGGGCPPATYDNTITIKVIPITTVDNQTVCGGVPATLTASGATSYLWSDNSSSPTLTASPLIPTSYTVTGTTAGCSSSAVGTITTNSTPTVTVNSATICSGGSAILTASGATNYSWSTGGGFNFISDNPLITTSYTVTGTTAGCSASAVGTITSNTTPTVTVNSPTVCKGQPATLTASGAANYAWSNATNINPLSVTPNATTSYTVIGNPGGCTASAVATVTVVQTPTVTVNNPTICVGGTATLIANGGSTYTWSTGAGGASITVNPVTPTSYTVSDVTAGCSGSAVSNVSVNIPPVVTPSANPSTICFGNSSTLTAVGNATSYLWSTGSVTNSATVSPITLTTYTVTGNPGGCSTTAIVSVAVNQLPVITVDKDTVCEGLPATLNASGTLFYTWSNGAATPTITVSPTSDQDYTVIGKDAAGCSSLPVIGKVKVYPKPGAAFTFSPKQAGVLSPVISFSDASSPDVNSWSWDFGDGNTLSPNTENPVHTYPATEQTYTVTLNVLNPGGCPNSVTRTVVIGPEFSFYIPNAFTPNDDGINDSFGAKGSGILKFQLLIFDRWGNQIFSANDIDKYWNGKVSGASKLVQEDVYVWKVRLTDIFKKEHSYLGTVTVVRGD